MHLVCLGLDVKPYVLLNVLGLAYWIIPTNIHHMD